MSRSNVKITGDKNALSTLVTPQQRIRMVYARCKQCAGAADGTIVSLARVISGASLRCVFGKTSLALVFWATVCKTVRPMLSDRCPVCPVLSETLVYCGQTVGWIKMKLGMPVGLGPGHIVLDGDPAPSPPKVHSPQFSAHICCGHMATCIKMPLSMEVGLSL